MRSSDLISVVCSSDRVRGVFLTGTEGARRLEAGGSREKQHGRVVIIGSITADKIFPATSVYGATKAAVRHMGKALAREWARRGINVNIIQPGYFESEMTADLFASEAGRKFVASFRSEEHTSELQSLMRISYADFCLK